MIEKRYRLKLNDKILSLQNAIPAFRSPLATPTEDPNDPGPRLSSKLNKGTILTKATEYIQQLEREKSSLEHEVASLKKQLAALKCERPEQGFQRGGVAAASEMMTCDNEKILIVPSNGMLSPESCTSVMSPEAEGIL